MYSCNVYDQSNCNSINKIINSIKCRNAIILAPSPKGARVCEKIVNLTQKAIKRVGAPVDIVQSLPTPINLKDTLSLINKVDFVVATGSQENIKKSIQTGTPTFGVGVGNVPSIIDISADLDEASNKIIISKTFDNSVVHQYNCSSILIKKENKKIVMNCN